MGSSAHFLAIFLIIRGIHLAGGEVGGAKDGQICGRQDLTMISKMFEYEKKNLT